MKKKLIKTIEVAHSDADYLKYELAKILSCDETEEAILNAVRSLTAVAKWAEKVPVDEGRDAFRQFKLDLLDLASTWAVYANTVSECVDSLRKFVDGDRSVIEKIERPAGEIA